MKDAASGILVAGIEGIQITPAELTFFQEEQIAGVTLFGWNITPRMHELAVLVKTFQATLRDRSSPYIIAIDQEGGRVARLKSPFPDLGPAQKVADGKDDPAALDAIRNYGFSVGNSLRALGIDTDFAPVCDILTNEANVGIGNRVWGVDPETVTKRAGAFLQGLNLAGVRSSLKHFPGQGDAAVDTHYGSAVVNRSLTDMEARELIPFHKLLHESPMVMLAHVIYPKVCSKRASASPTWIDLLQKKWGYKGLIVSDDMGMGALAQDDKLWQAELVESVVAGVDMLLVCRYLARFKVALEGLRREMAKSPAFTAKIEQAAMRVQKLRQTPMPTLFDKSMAGA